MSSCPVCKTENDTQEHALPFKELQDSVNKEQDYMFDDVVYTDIFEDIEKTRPPLL